MATWIKRGKKQLWTALYYLNGKRFCFCSKTSNKHVAEGKLWDIIKKREEGQYINNKKITFKEVAEKWFEVQSTPDKSKRTLDSYENTISVHLIAFFKDFKIDAIKVLDVENFKAALSKKVSPTTTNYSIRILRSILNSAVDWGYLSVNCALKVKMLKQVRKEQRVLTKEEVQKLLDNLEGQSKNIVLTAILTGLRIGELCAMRWVNLNWDNRTYTVKESYHPVYGFSAPKTKDSYRTILLPQSLLEVLRQHRVEQNKHKLKIGSGYTENGLIFSTDKGTPIRDNNFRRREFYEALKKIGVPRIPFHHLRKTHATLLLESGANPRYVQEQLGHRDPAMTLGIYAQVNQSSRQEAIQKFETYLFASNNSSREQGNLSFINEISVLSKKDAEKNSSKFAANEFYVKSG